VAKVVAVSKATTILFVYGTLKRGLGNHHHLAGQEFLGEALTEPRYRLIDLRSYPGLIVDDANGLAVKGELWSVDAACLADLDEFEEVHCLFIRKPVRIPGRGLVHAYFWNQKVPVDARSGDRWPL
jgi:gamma-glutamylaminecyclotransferase